MPYIKKEARDDIDEELYSLIVAMNQSGRVSEGDCNYVISNILNYHLVTDQPTYHRINSAIGVLECAKMELYRRIAVPYEEGKRFENGEVY